MKIRYVLVANWAPLLGAFITLLVASNTHAEEVPEPKPSAPETKSAGPIALPIGGRIFSDFYVPTRDVHDSSFRFVDTSLWLQADPKLDERTSARFILTEDALNTSIGSANGSLRTRLREGYITYANKGWEFRAGQQIIPWGKSDAINPTDLLSAKDYTFFNPDEEIRRVGATNAWLSFTPDAGNSPLTLQAIVQPVFPQSTLLIAPGEVPAGVTYVATPSAPATTVANTEAALKASYVGTGWDADAFFFKGFNHMPELVRSGPFLAPVVSPTFHRIHATGGDASYATGKLIFRAETAYVWTENSDGTNPTIIPTHWDSVLGVERPFGDDFRAQVQVIERYFPHYTNPQDATGANPLDSALNQGLARANALLLNYQDKARTSATFRFSYTNDQNGIDAEVFTLMNFMGGDYLLRPKFGYAWTDAFRTTVGTDYYAGPDDRPLGALKAYNSVFFEAKYAF